MFNVSMRPGLMKRCLPLLAAVALLPACTQTATSDPKPEPKVAAPKVAPVPPADAGYVSLFNGKDLTGWGYPNGPTFDGLTVVPGDDRRFMAVDGALTAYARPEL